jgi:hypothetical protein
MGCAHRPDPRKETLRQIQLERPFAFAQGQRFEVKVDGRAFLVDPWLEREAAMDPASELHTAIVDADGAQIECTARVVRTMPTYGDNRLPLMESATARCESTDLQIEVELDGWPDVVGNAEVGERDYGVVVSSSNLHIPTELLVERDGLPYLFVSHDGTIWIDPDLAAAEHRAMVLLATALWASPQLRMQ